MRCLKTYTTVGDDTGPTLENNGATRVEETAMDIKSRILVVDDEPKNVKLLDAHLTPRGYEVITAENGMQALELIEREKPDLVLLDVMMPKMDGLEVLKKIRTDEATKLLPVILITALQETKDRVKGIEAGCDDFISKPFDKNEVLARVATLLKMNYYRAQLDEKKKFEFVLSEIEDGIVVLDATHKVVRCNEWACDNLAIGIGDDLSRMIDKLTSAFTVHFDGDLNADLQTRPLSFEIERRETKAAGALIYDVHTEIIVSPAGEPTSIVIMFNDVTERRREERLKHSFLGLISHKLRTPIAIVTQYADMVRAGAYGELNEKQKKAMDAVRIKSYSLMALVEHLIGFVTVGEREVVVKQEHVNLSQYLEEIVKPLAVLYPDKPFELDISCPKSLEADIKTAYYNPIVSNLVDNAIKFNDKDDRRVKISAKAEGEKLSIEVTDNGPGIPPEERKKIFEKFYQTEKYFTGNVEGVGLGLPLVKHLVSACGGELRVESELGKGSTFSVTLPNN